MLMSKRCWRFLPVNSIIPLIWNFICIGVPSYSLPMVAGWKNILLHWWQSYETCKGAFYRNRTIWGKCKRKLLCVCGMFSCDKSYFSLFYRCDSNTYMLQYAHALCTSKYSSMDTASNDWCIHLKFLVISRRYFDAVNCVLASIVCFHLVRNTAVRFWWH